MANSACGLMRAAPTSAAPRFVVDYRSAVYSVPGKRYFANSGINPRPFMILSLVEVAPLFDDLPLQRSRKVTYLCFPKFDPRHLD
jgi:hypothetical protein